MTCDTNGIDISKATLDIHRLSGGKAMTFRNCPAGLKSLAKFCANNCLIHSKNTLVHSMKNLRSIPGLGAVCAAAILIEMPRSGVLIESSWPVCWQN